MIDLRTYLLEKKFVNLEVVWDSVCFWPKMGVVGAEPRRHAFSYDVSAKREIQNVRDNHKLTFLMFGGSRKSHLYCLFYYANK